MWQADVSMTSPGGQGLLTLAAGPADISIDLSTLTGQRSRVKGSALTSRLTGGALSQAGKKKKEKGVGPIFGPKEVLGRLKAQ
jgi:hypothetical protein